ncbi:glutamyl-tRNA reductase [uncultured Cellulomonas sp.]|uniref:glutamyl-tRNA reductase n=1 Tax=uncultured Cellulomonas sp. TaxID=189682 RepID=UPI0026395E96|nr:glutamyl-tRNA reductase [uncultured Cellulomonas sp.]
MSLIASHRDLDLDVLERLSAGAQSVGRTVAASGAAPTGTVVLATCNRFEVYLEVDRPDQAPAAVDATTRVIAHASGIPTPDVTATLQVLHGPEVPAHLFSVASGLESMVVGEREITGQVRRALATARAEGTTSSGLERLFQTASRASRDVGTRTGLGAAGRSVVGVALELAEPGLPPWPQVRALLVGTGSYAGASLAALRRHGCADIRVFSPSGRAATFAAARGIVPVHDGGLADAIGTSDLVVACSGTVGRVLDAELVGRTWAATGHPQVVADLALRNDVDPAVGRLPGVRLINLDTIRRHAPEEQSAPVELAHDLVAAAAADFEAVTRARELEAAVVAERRRVLGELEAEAGRIRAADEAAGEPTPVTDAQQPVPGLAASDGVCAAATGTSPEEHARLVRSLRRRTRALLHPPTVRARTAARAGDDRAYRAALAELAAIPAPPVPAPPPAGATDQEVAESVR